VGTICKLALMSYSITLDYRRGTKKPIKELQHHSNKKEMDNAKDILGF